MPQLRIVFMGTPEFAVPSLRILVENGYNVVGVVTAPDKPKGRGQKVATSPVKDYAVSAGLKVLQPPKLKDPEWLEEFKSLDANLGVVVAFRMLPRVVWEMPELGTFNLHASLLPQYRGAAPINWALMNGEKETGVTTFFLKHAIDTGDLIYQQPEPIGEADTVGDVYGRLMDKGSGLVLKTVQAIERGDAPRTPQPAQDTELKSAPKIFRDTCEIHWNQPVAQVYNHIRGLSPYPAAWTELLDKSVKIFGTHKTNQSTQGAEPGSYTTDGKTYLHFACADEWLAINELQLQGKKRMGIEDFLRGNSL